MKNSKPVEQYLMPEEMEKQEHLSLERLAGLFDWNNIVPTTPRPPANFIDLMNWVLLEFGKSLKDQHRLNKFVHNRIIIDGPFLQFCEERKVKIECLFQDSTISWKTDHNYEKFFVQGVFKIKTKEVEFLHAALFQKGNQLEDEVSFFIICSETNYPQYVKFRNEFDEWVAARDRSNLHVRVIEGDDIPYTKENTWEDLFLPNDIKNDLKGLVESFLASKDFYLQNKIAWKRGILLWGKPGNGKSSLIKTIMSVYPFKPITIAPGSNDEAMREAFSYAEEQNPSLLYFEDLDSMLDRTIDTSSFLNLMDGIATKNGMLVIATANDVKKLKPNITDRPSRFDRKFEIPLPNNEMAYAYLRKWFADFLPVKKCRELAKFSVRYGFSYSHLKELFVSSMFEALAHNRKSPTIKDVDHSLLRLVKDKSMLHHGQINMDKYLQ